MLSRLRAFLSRFCACRCRFVCRLLWWIFHVRRAALVKRLTRRLEAAREEIRELKHQLKLAESARTIAETEVESLSQVVARNQKRTLAETAEWAARQAAAERGEARISSG